MPFLTLLIIALMVGALIDIIRRDDAQVKHLPKLVWVILVVLLPLIGSALWFALGREYASGGVRMPRMSRPQAATQARPEQSWTPPRDFRSTEQQLADLDREIEEWQLRAEVDRKRQERGES